MVLSMKASWFRQVLFFGAGICAILSLSVGASLAHASTYIERVLHKPVPGGVAVLYAGQAERAPEVFLDGHRVMVIKDADDAWKAIVGIDLKTKPGVLSLQDNQNLGLQVAVSNKHYKEQHIRLKNQAHVNPDPKQQERFAAEYAEQIEAYSQYRPDGPSNVIFDKPVPGRLSSPFGLRRFFNGEERNPHSGLDLASPQGTPIHAPADGVITIVGDYFFNGKTVFIDHGQGFITMYCHLSAVDVQRGATIKRGEVLGRVGATGRATGPHLHWNVSLNNARVDPAIFIQAFQP